MPRSRAAPASRSSGFSRGSRSTSYSSSSRPAPASSSYTSQAHRPTAGATPHSAPPPAPAPITHAAPPPALQTAAPQGGGFLSAMATGAAVGTGSAIAHRAIGGLFGGFGGGGHYPAQPAADAVGAPAPVQAAPAPSELPCSQQMRLFSECMSAQNGNMDACRPLFEAMQKCKVGLGGAAGSFDSASAGWSSTA